MPQFFKTQLMANGWPTIDIEPMADTLFFKILDHLCITYHIPTPRIIDTIDGYAADLMLLDSAVSLHIDAWTFAIAFEKHATRDQVLAALLTLPENYFEQ
jgi:hypothetical protein